MNIIIPMAGMGKRMRPHTLTVPKPLIPIAGKPIVQRLVEDIVKVANCPISEIGFVVGHFGDEVEKNLLNIAESVGAKGKIYYQEEALGTAHAIYCARDLLVEKTIVAFADTLFKADFTLEIEQDGIIWVQQVADPSAFGVIKLNDQNQITDFVEKPSTYVSDLAIIGIYYFKDGPALKKEIEYLLENKISKGGEFQLTDALENLKNKNTKFTPGKVTEWLDCGNKNSTVFTNQRYLEYIVDNKDLVAQSATISGSVIIPPVYIGENAKIHNTILGPHVSVGDNTIIEDSRIKNSIIQKGTKIKNANFANSMIGNFVSYEGKILDVSIGDYNSIIE
ncbi:MAG: sugar phosphate nucleotidyltransferase [Bacteroidota bacterium]|jgi:glucose-1-phosphate thymidylyltransferase|nr:sugar phosphate nucleotidyltransferase [Bacteroidota bacterium]